MLSKIIAKELRETWRDRRLCLALSAVPILLVAALGAGCYEASRLGQSQEESRQAARLDWLNQGDHGAHSAAHHGTFLFKPTSPLSFFDPGLDPYLGTTVRIEAHHQHRPANLPAADSADPLRFGAPTAAFLLQVVFPLIAILLGFSGISGERERGTLPMLLGLGVPPRAILLGKAAAILTIATVLAAPASLSFAWTLASAGDFRSFADVSFRSASLAAGYSAYLAGWALLALGVSARASSSGSALSILIAAWAISVLIVPRLGNDAATRLYPLPTQEEFEKQVARIIRTGKDGKTSIRDLRKGWEAELLAEYGVEDAEDLPINPEGVLMQRGEDHANEIRDEANASLAETFDRQGSLIRCCSVVSPYLAIREASMALAGADRPHHERFGLAAEAYRRGLVRTLNEADSQRKGPDGAVAVKAGPALWGEIEDFRYRAPGWAWAARAAATLFLVLAAWLGAAAWLALSAKPGMHGGD